MSSAGVANGGGARPARRRGWRTEFASPTDPRQVIPFRQPQSCAVAPPSSKIGEKSRFGLSTKAHAGKDAH